jgi:sugar O-acyltransferase (sialic acid O-acetyltransferase NeuD family)
MTDIIFWGATGQGRVLKELLEGSGHQLVAVFDNREMASPFSDIPLIVGRSGFESWLKARGNNDLQACVAIGGDKGRERLEIQDWLSTQGVRPISLLHRTAFISSDASIGEGSQVLAQSALCANSRIGRAVIINTSASIDHCTIIGDGAHIGPGAVLAGEVVVESFVFIGAGATILPRIKIGKGAVVGAGAVVTKDVATEQVVVGNPARPVNIDRRTHNP